ncbi:MAG: Dam family site-specific DNA-(adenine-N6)-methyltransferase [Vicinamibacterales bacterium]|jgi:DNA adenine methylase|nr:Dam family site-specific DNA-(adenine-N6)-methyltransferase [Vicinamibacterales bacterium]MDP7478183.1 Dam family site-specific DNA-(adenine-N6)-methyltransferase [Vicinamibacterales bacterium]|tara:strand:- start:3843 stop:4709 length:867 start_codon:yes stop_codon:yes gene_type:complete
MKRGAATMRRDAETGRVSSTESQSPLDADAAPLSPPLKWAGGKRWLTPSLAPIWASHRHRRLVEPFCGGLAVALGLDPRRALLADTNPHLINFYAWLQRGLRITLPMRNDEALFYRHRTRFNALARSDRAGTAEAAALFYFLNRTCYNGLCRFNRAGEFNVPFGRYVRIGYTRDFTAYRAALARWTFCASDIDAVGFSRNDFIYADPPYDVQFTQYSRGGFTWDDQVRTAERLAKHPGPVVLSNQATPRIRKLYRQLGFTLRYLNAPRMISCTGRRVPAREVLAAKNL